MVKKIAGAVVVLGLAYLGGSYFVGHRATQMMADMRANVQEQSNGAIVWENVQSSNGLFSSEGAMTMVLNTVELDGGQSAKVNVDYVIHHALSLSHVAHFVWSATPDAALAQAMAPLYPSAPSLAGDGHMYWAGRTTSSIGFPGVQEAQTENAIVSLSALEGSITSGKNTFDLSLMVNEILLRDQRDPGRLAITGLTYHAESADVDSGSGLMKLTLDEAQLIGQDGQAQTLKGYEWLFDLRYVDNVLSFDTAKTAQSLQILGSEINAFEFKLGIDGLHRQDVQDLARLSEQTDGSVMNMTDEQREQLQRIGLGMLAKGLTVRVPAIKADVKLLGSPSVEAIGVTGFSLSAQMTNPEQNAGHVRLALQELSTPVMLQAFVPQISALVFDFTNEVVDGRANLSIKKSLGSYELNDQSAKDVVLDVSLKGVKADDLFELIELVQVSGGDLDYLDIEEFERLGEILHDAAAHGLTLDIPRMAGTVATGSGTSDSLVLSGLNLNVKLDDALLGTGKATVELAELAARGPSMGDIPQIKAYKLTMTNEVTNGRVEYQIEKSVDAYKDEIFDIGPSVMAMRLSGLSADDLAQFFELAQQSAGAIDDEQFDALMQLARNAIETGFELAIPTLKITVDQAELDGQAMISLAGLDGAPLTSFDLGRLGQMDVELAIKGQSPWVTPFVQEGIAMGIVTPIDGGAQAQLGFKDGQLLFNGQAMPAGEFIMMGNEIVQDLLADTQ